MSGKRKKMRLSFYLNYKVKHYLNVILDLRVKNHVMNYIYTIDSWKSVSNMPENVKERFYIMGSETIISSIGNYKDSDVVLLFIPGNPGIIDVYDVFLEELYRALQIPVVGISHGGSKIRFVFNDVEGSSRNISSKSKTCPWCKNM